MVELDVDFSLVVEIAGAVRLVHARHDAVEQRQILRRGTPRRIFGATPRFRAGIPDSRPPCDASRSVRHRLENSWPIMSATCVPPPAWWTKGRAFERLQRIAQDWPRHPNWRASCARPAPVACAQTLEDEVSIATTSSAVRNARS
jgi:hypothetical protein